MKKYTTILAIFLSFSAWAEFPPKASSVGGCSQEGILFKNNQVILNADHKALHRVFLFHNNTAGNVVLNNNNAGTLGTMGSAGWTSKIDSNRWSALAMTQANFYFSCQGFNPPFYKLMDCNNAISVCSYTAKSTTGSFWISENKTLDEIAKTLNQRNILE